MSSCLYKEILPPSGVTHSATAFFTHLPGCGQPPNIIVAKSTRLEVYTVKSYQTPNSSNGSSNTGATAPTANASTANSASSRLELLGSYQLYGVLESMAVLRARAALAQRDALMLTFRDAKLSVVEWDLGAHTIRCSSLHYFESDPMLKEGRTVFALPPRVVADPMGRCAAVIMFNHQVALLPALETDFEFIGLSQQQGQRQQYEASPCTTLGSHFILNLSMKGLGIQEVRDAVFLHGYSEPVLLVLHEPDPTWPGRYKERKDTCVVAALSLSMTRRRHTKLWSHVGLPSACHSLVPVPGRPAALVLSQAHIMYVSSQGTLRTLCVGTSGRPGLVPPRLEFNSAVEAPHITAAKVAKEYATNVHPDVVPAVSKGATDVPGLDVDLSGCRTTWLSPRSCLIGLRTGQHLVLHVQMDGAQFRGLQVVLLTTATPAPTSMCTFLEASLRTQRLAAAGAAAGSTSGGTAGSSSHLFLGSYTGDAMLMSYALEEGKGFGVGRVLKKRRLEQQGQGQEGDAAGAEEEGQDAPAVMVTLKELDRLLCLGPLRDMLHLDTSLMAAQQEALGPRGGPTIFALTGHERGVVAMLRRGLVPEVVTDVTLPGVHGMWALYHRREEAAVEDEAAIEASAWGDYHAYLLLSEDGARTKVLETGEELAEVTEGCRYKTDQPLCVLATCSAMPALVQICPTSIGLFDGMELIQELQLEELLLGMPPQGVVIKSAQISDPYVLLSLSNGLSLLLEGNIDSMMLTLAHAAAQQLLTRPLDDPSGASAVDACCIFRDETGWLAARHAAAGGPAAEAAAAAAAAADQAAGGTAGAPALPDGLPASADKDASVDPDSREGAEVKGVAVGDMDVAAADTDAGSLVAAAAEAAAAGAGAASAAGMQQDGTDIDMADAEGASTKPGEAAAAGEAAASEAGEAVAAVEAGPGGEAAAGEAAALPAAEETHQAAGMGHAAEEAAEQEADLNEGQELGLQLQQPQEEQEQQQQQSWQQYLVVCRHGGLLELFLLPGMEPVLSSRGLALAQELLQQQQQGEAASAKEKALLESGRVVEIRMESFKGPNPGLPTCERPVLLALLATGRLVVYQAFARPCTVENAEAAAAEEEGAKASAEAGAGGTEEHMDRVSAEPRADTASAAAECVDGAAADVRPCGFAFRRLDVDWLPHQARADVSGMPSGTPRMVRFDNLAYLDPLTNIHGPNTSGVFVCGTQPLWLIASRGRLVPHPMSIEGPVSAMTPFHNYGCRLGFILACPSGSLKVCQLPIKARLDTPWVCTRAPLKATPHRLALYREGNLLAVAVSRSMTYRPRLPEEPGGDPHASAAYAAADAAAQQAGKEEGHEIRLLELPACLPVPGSRPLPLAPGESAASLRAVNLRDHSAADGSLTVPLLAVGTSAPLGEDYPCLGRVLLFQLDRSRDGAGGVGGWRGRLVAQREFPGPVTCLRDFKGLLLIGVGSRVELHSWSSATQQQQAGPGGGMARVAFFDAPMLVTSLNAVKDYILLGDMHQGVQFLRYVEASRGLTLLGRDFDNHDVMATGIVINVTKLLFVYADRGGTLRQVEYMKNHPQSWAGMRLVPEGAMHVGLPVVRFLASKMASPDGANRHALLMATASGSLGIVEPVWDGRAAARLAALQRVLATRLPHAAGLNPRAFRRRHLRTPGTLGGGRTFGRALLDADVKPADAPPGRSVHAPNPNSFVDGDLLYGFAALSRRQQAELAEEAGLGAAGAEVILADLALLDGAVTL